MKKKKHLKVCRFTSFVPSHSIKIFTIPLEIVELEDNSYHLIVQVEIDGIRGDMIIDTGASVTVIDSKLFPGKPTRESIMKMQSGSVTGQIEDIRLIEAKLFKIGGKKIKNIQLAEIDLDYVNDMYHHHLKRKIIGLLGCDFCVKYQVIINYQKKELTLHSPKQI